MIVHVKPFTANLAHFIAPQAITRARGVLNKKHIQRWLWQQHCFGTHKEGTTPMEIEPWMVRSAIVIAALLLIDCALYALNVWLDRRKVVQVAESLSRTRQNDRAAAA